MYLGIEITQSIIAIMSFVIIFIQLIWIYKSFLADHERRKKQSTIEYVTKIRQASWPLEIELRKEYGDKTINVEDIGKNNEIIIGRFLSNVEHLAAGVNTGVFEVNIVNRMIGSHLIDMYDKLLPYMKSARMVRNTNTLYLEYKQLKEKIEKLRIEYIKEGEIINS